MTNGSKFLKGSNQSTELSLLIADYLIRKGHLRGKGIEPLLVANSIKLFFEEKYEDD